MAGVSFVSSVVGVGRAPLLGTCPFPALTAAVSQPWIIIMMMIFFAGGEGRSLAMKLIVLEIPFFRVQ